MSSAEKVARELLKEHKWETGRIGRFFRWLFFKLGFSQCRHCVYCEVESSEHKGKYRGIRESMILRDGRCYWSKESASSMLTYQDLRKFHRCPGFVEMLYNFKDYGIDSKEIKKIKSARLQLFFTWLGYIIAILIAIFRR